MFVDYTDCRFITADFYKVTKANIRRNSGKFAIQYIKGSLKSTVEGLFP